MRKRTPTIAIKLSAVDHVQFEQFCRLEGKNKSEVAREAISFYMKTKEMSLFEEYESKFEAQLRKLENRFAGLLVKVGVGVYSLQHLLWTRTEEHERSQLFSECYQSGVKMMRAKLKADEESLRTQSNEQA